MIHFPMVSPLNMQKNRFQTFSMEKLTTNLKTLVINQSTAGLNISVKSANSPAQVIPKHQIIGLPKLNQIPKAFFDTCYAIASTAGSITTVDFRVKGPGGMYQAPQQALVITIPGLPRKISEIEAFYKVNPAVQSQVTQFIKAGSVRLGDAIDFMITGASGLSIAHLTGRLLPECGVELAQAKDMYSSLVAEFAAKFIEMQTNNMRVVRGHIDAAKLGQLRRAWISLARIKKRHYFR